MIPWNPIWKHLGLEAYPKKEQRVQNPTAESIMKPFHRHRLPDPFSAPGRGAFDLNPLRASDESPITAC